jgi:hypothetical protein
MHTPCRSQQVHSKVTVLPHSFKVKILDFTRASQFAHTFFPQASILREYHKALLRVPIIPIAFLALWGLAVYFIQGSLKLDIFSTILDRSRSSKNMEDTELQDAATTNLTLSTTPRQIIFSALVLLLTVFWCFLVWCGILGGSNEGAVLGNTDLCVCVCA